MRCLLVLLLFLLSFACSAARAQERLGPLVHAADRAGDGRSDQGEIALALWAWRLERGEPARRLISEAILDCSGDARALLDALRDPPPLPALEGDEPLDLLLAAPPGETVLERAVRSARFTRGLDRVPLPATLEALDARHPWVADVRARWTHVEPVVRGLGRIFDALVLPVDPRTAERVRLASATGRWDGDLWSDEGKATGGWVVAKTASHLTILDDRLRRRRVAVEHARPEDVDDLVRRWAIPGEGPVSGYDALDLRSCGALALRAWWALERGQTWTAARIAEDAVLIDRDDTSSTRLGMIAYELGRAVQEATFIDLSANRPRAESVATLRGAIRAVDAVGPPTDELAAEQWRELRADLLNFADRLEVQDAALRAAPQFPTWVEWERLTIEERLPHLIRALADCDGEPTSVIFGGVGKVWGASQRLPLDAPAHVSLARRSTFSFEIETPLVDGEPSWTDRRASGCSAADWLEDAGEVAIPALIEALADLSPSRCVGSEGEMPNPPLTVGDCAADLLGSIIGLDDLELQPRNYEGALAYQLETQARARAWWAEVAPRGGVFPLHVAKLVELEADARSRSSHASWLLRRGGGREVDLLRGLVLSAPTPEARAGWLRALGQARHDGYDALLVAELESEDTLVAMAATGALVDRGDRRGLPRAVALTIDGGATDEAVGHALAALTQAEAPELTTVALQIVVARPTCDGALLFALTPAPESAERLLTLARIAARPALLGSRVEHRDDPALWAMNALEPPEEGRRFTPLTSDRRRIVVSALAEALRRRADPDALEHAAVTASLVGHAAIAALCSGSGHDLRRPLLAALSHDDPPRRDVAKAAVERLGVDGRRWLRDGVAVVREDGHAAALGATLRVVWVDVAPEAPRGVHAALEAWHGDRLDLDRVSDVLEAWEEGELEALELVIDRLGRHGGVRVQATCPVAGPDAPGWLLRVEARVAGVTHEAATNDALPPSRRATHALDAVKNALIDHPDAAARIVIRAER